MLKGLSRLLKKSQLTIQLYRYNNFLNGSNANYLDNMYQKWLKDQNSVQPDYQLLFQQVQDQDSQMQDLFPYKEKGLGVQNGQTYSIDAAKIIAVHNLIEGYRQRGHEKAKLNPLRLTDNQSGLLFSKNSEKVSLEQYGLSKSDLQSEFLINDLGFFQNLQSFKLSEIVQKMEEKYCGPITIETSHITSLKEKQWICDMYENGNVDKSKEKMKKIFDRLYRNHLFNEAMHYKIIPHQKRFTGEGVDTLISGIGNLIDLALENDVECATIGMPHRGRLNLLSVLFQKPLLEFYKESKGMNIDFETVNWENIQVSSDVKYHHGYLSDVKQGEKFLRLSLLNNPSHLEIVNGVVYGNIRAQKDEKNLTESHDHFNKTLGIVVHGDAALAGQGPVYENLQMMNLDSFKIDGCIHVVANNMIGFTTTQKDARSTLYATDIAKFLGVPIIHVNANYPLEVNYAFELAFQYKQKFQKDVFIDIIGYRIFGHNEIDNPEMTQPLMYKAIQSEKDKVKEYEKSFSLLNEGQINPIVYNFTIKCLKEGIISEEDILKLKEEYTNQVDIALDKKNHKFVPQEKQVYKHLEKTFITQERVQSMTSIISVLPSSANIMRNIQKVYQQRNLSILKGEIDWSTAEAFAFRSLIEDGFSIRLSGEDVQRGTFSQRLAILHDQKTDNTIFPIAQGFKKNPIYIGNSHLSEYAVLAFEYGYSQARPNCLTIWEAQFGDFANCAQAVIDNFYLSGETKWYNQNSLVLNLPHGMQGQGPEHSSARIERFLQLHDDDYRLYLKDSRHIRITQANKLSNFSLVYCSTPANYFHVLRRQMGNEYRKPLVNIFSKGLLRNFYSPIQDIQENSEFQKVIDDGRVYDPKLINKVVFCTGFQYYTILKEINRINAQNIALVRIEELAPFPYIQVEEIIEKYFNCEKYVFSQEEHFNQGAFSFVQPRINSILKKQGISKEIQYNGRIALASTAVGLGNLHDKEIELFLEDLLSNQCQLNQDLNVCKSQKYFSYFLNHPCKCYSNPLYNRSYNSMVYHLQKLNLLLVRIGILIVLIILHIVFFMFGWSLVQATINEPGKVPKSWV